MSIYTFVASFLFKHFTYTFQYQPLNRTIYPITLYLQKIFDDFYLMQMNDKGGVFGHPTQTKIFSVGPTFLLKKIK